MYQTTVHSLPSKNKKSAAITVRCTPEDKRKTKEKADSLGETLSEFSLECIEAGIKNNVRNKKQMARVLVKMQENMNQIMLSLKSEHEELGNSLIEYSKGAMGLWEY